MQIGPKIKPPPCQECGKPIGTGSPNCTNCEMERVLQAQLEQELSDWIEDNSEPVPGKPGLRRVNIRSLFKRPK